MAHDVIIPDGVVSLFWGVGVQDPLNSFVAIISPSHISDGCRSIQKACSLTTPIVSFLSDCRAFDFLFELFDFQASVLYSDSSSRPLRPLDP